jgi:electron transfer flavoprotein beta subunit
MNIVVAMKQVPDLKMIRIRDRRPLLEDVPFMMGDIDRSALEAGVDLREALKGKLVVLSAGTDPLEDTVKEALAAGADEAVLILDEVLRDAESALIARVLAAALARMPDVAIVLFGEGSADNYSGQVMARVAEILKWPQVGYAREIRIEESVAYITRSLEDCEELLEVPLPVAVSVVAEIRQPKTPSVTSILRAGRKPKTLWTLTDLDIGLNEGAPVRTISRLAPVSSRIRQVIGSVDELEEILKAKRGQS